MMIRNKLAMYALMFGAALATSNQTLGQKTKKEPYIDRFKNYTDMVIKKLVSDGVCFINSDDFEMLYNKLPSKLRGEVLFHSDIDSKKIFITYTKFTH